MQKRKYEVSGTDDLGDFHTFATDDRERAEEVKAIMGMALEDTRSGSSECRLSTQSGRCGAGDTSPKPTFVSDRALCLLANRLRAGGSGTFSRNEG